MAREKAKLEGNIVKFTMTCKRDSFAPEHTFKVRIDITGVKTDALIPFAFGGASFRVKLQAWMRAHWTEEMFVQKAQNPLKLTFDEVVKGQAVPLGDSLMALDKDKFVALMVEQLGTTKEEAVVIYNRKHGIQ